MGKIKLRKAFKDSLRNMYYESGKGVSKHAVDASDGVERVHCRETLNTYSKQADRFVDYCYAHDCKYDMEQARALVNPYLQEMIDSGKMSASTIRTAGSALAKVFGCKSTDFGVTYPKRERAAIKRSRYAAERDKHVSQTANELLITMARCTGLRRNEIAHLNGNDLIQENGRYYVRVGKAAKGGRPRKAMIIADSKEMRMIVKAFQEAGHGKVFDHIHTKLDVHALRAQYACNLYKLYARPLDKLDRSEQYRCRKDKAGIVYDRKAMRIASDNLGHNRVEIIASNYLHNL